MNGDIIHGDRWYEFDVTNINAHQFKNLSDFVEKTFCWDWPQKFTEVCYGGTFAIHNSNLYRNKYLSTEIAKIISILKKSKDDSIVEHFMERLWAALLMKPFFSDEIDAIENTKRLFVQKGKTCPILEC